MSTYKLYTFKQADGGEVVRRMLIHSGQKFEEVRVRKEEWTKLKDEIGFASLPVLEVDGKKLGGTLPICEFLGEKLGMAAGGDAWTRAQLNSLCDSVYEVIIVLSRYWSENDPTIKQKKKTEILKESVPSRLARINKCIQENGCPDGYACCNQLTYADFFIQFLFCDVLTRIHPPEQQKDEAKKYPAVSKLCEAMGKHPNIKKYCASRDNLKFFWEC